MRLLFSKARPSRSVVVIGLATALFCLGTTTAGAASEIEGVWSFNGGEVAVHAIAGGKFEGVVVAPTRFAECTHQLGEAMWTEMTQQSNGSYWGAHQWLFEKSCTKNPEPGPTAWRVLHASNGTRELEVCFSAPGQTQPTIASNGTSANASYGCVKSTPTAPLPVVSSAPSTHPKAGRISFATTVLLPRPSTCVRRGILKIKIKEPQRDPLRELVIHIGRHRALDIHSVKRLARGIVLGHLPAGTYTLKIVATTVLGQKLKGSRTYHSCTRGHFHRIKLHHNRHGHN